MKRIVVFFSAVILWGLVQMIFPTIVGATDYWGEGDITPLSRGKTTIFQGGSLPCDGNELTIDVTRYGKITSACVYGEAAKMRLARFPVNGIFQYAIAFSGSETFTELRGICPKSRCVYSSSSDVLIMHFPIGSYLYSAGIYKNFSKHITRQFDVSVMSYYYQFSSEKQPDYSPSIGNTKAAVEAAAISANGKWAVLELNGFGFLRVNTETLEARRVVAPGGTYGLASDPRYEMSITNDGKYLAIMGWKAGGTVYSISDGCGDYLAASTSLYFAQYIAPCKSSSVDRSYYLSSVLFLSSPRFNANGDRLGFTIMYSNGYIERIVLATNIETMSPQLQYLALGDSFTSGEGELEDRFYLRNSNTLPIKCHTSSRSYPYLLGLRWNATTENIACSGARTSDVVASSVYKGQQNAYEAYPLSQLKIKQESALDEFNLGVVPQIDFVSYHQPTVVSLGIGGNDAGLVGKLKACLNIDTCEWVEDTAKRYATMQEIAAVYPKIQSVVREIKRQSPVSKVMLIGYPQIIDSTSNAKCDTVLGALLNHDERIFMNETIKYLNQIIAAIAGAERVGYVDSSLSFGSHLLCGQTDSRAMNGIRFGDDIAPLDILKDFKVFGSESFHPTPYGHDLIANKVAELYHIYTPSFECDECNPSGNLPVASSYWGDSSENAHYVRQIEVPEMSASSAYLGDELLIKTEPYLFTPNTEVVVEMHSQPLNFGSVMSSEDGSIRYSAIIPESLAVGYHTLHIFGTAPDGKKIDAYKVVAIVKKTESNHIDLNNSSPQLNDSPNVSRQLTSTSIGKNSANNPVLLGTLGKDLSVLGVMNKSTNVDKEADKTDAIAAANNSTNNIILWLMGALGLATVIAGILLLKFRFR